MKTILVISISLLICQLVNAQNNGDIIEETLEIETTDNEESVETNKEVFIIVEEMPKFQGQSWTTFIKYINEHIKYPEEAADTELSGQVYVQFVVDSLGKAKNIEILRGAGQFFDQETIRIIKSSPQWEPGKQRGKAVNVRLVFSVYFNNN